MLSLTHHTYVYLSNERGYDDTSNQELLLDVPVHSIDRTSREESVFSSFKVSVDSSNISVKMDEEFWPQGIGLQEIHP